MTPIQNLTARIDNLTCRVGALESAGNLPISASSPIPKRRVRGDDEIITAGDSYTENGSCPAALFIGKTVKQLREGNSPAKVYTTQPLPARRVRADDEIVTAGDSYTENGSWPARLCVGMTVKQLRAKVYTTQPLPPAPLNGWEVLEAEHKALKARLWEDHEAVAYWLGRYNTQRIEMDDLKADLAACRQTNQKLVADLAKQEQALKKALKEDICLHFVQPALNLRT
jgi:hypothetical protein